MKTFDKTNAMRLLDICGVVYEPVFYDSKGYLDGKSVAEKLSLPFDIVYKTIVVRGKSYRYYVCMLPVDKELDLKKTAVLFGEKAVGLIPVNDINMATGYEKGACSPIGMKKRYPAAIHAKASEKEHILVSAGRFGVQLRLRTEDLIRITGALKSDIISE